MYMCECMRNTCKSYFDKFYAILLVHCPFNALPRHPPTTTTQLVLFVCDKLQLTVSTYASMRFSPVLFLPGKCEMKKIASLLCATDAGRKRGVRRKKQKQKSREEDRKSLANRSKSLDIVAQSRQLAAAYSLLCLCVFRRYNG
ncbi:unnamed protein product [Ceratitis capitata]|uniref:(Mediterranean fruit fly) hypothetical protein n=1 Tax=Ceratitis capitata TaxID=7213 RepID=A0A811U3Y2_CERCA|nr:unnamed protein product [Ceratitis capitata]